jgi:hypothetical protein
MLSGTLALLSLAAGVAGPVGPDKAAQRYRLDLVLTQAVDLTSAGQGELKSDVTSTAFVTVTMSDTTGGRLAHVVIDSLTVVGNGPLAGQFSQALADALKGESLHGYIVDGKLQGAAKPSVDANPTLNLVMPVMNALFPGVGARAATTQSWSDTTQNNVTNEQGTQNSQSIVAWTVTGREGTVFTLTGAGTGTTSVEGEQQQATGTVTSSITVSTVAGGPAKSTKLTSSQELSVLVPSLPDPIPVKVDTEATLTELP